MIFTSPWKTRILNLVDVMENEDTCERVCNIISAGIIWKLPAKLINGFPPALEAPVRALLADFARIDRNDGTA